MEKFPFPHSAFLTLLLLACCGQQVPEEISLVYNDLPAIVDFNFHVKPILSDRCYKCHGPDDNARQAEFRLDLEEGAFAKLNKSGGRAFVKGNIGKSVAWKRITSEDQEFHMPPPESNLSLSAKEKALITKWIEQGAEWKPHWSFIAPQRAEIPKDLPADWTVNNPVDNFILGRLKEQGLSPSTEADKEHLIRRLSFDLTGLPPTIQEIDDFLADDDHLAYEKLVDRLLTTDAHAERMALEWLDVARYGDTQGLHGDAERYHWPWRDWVIKVFKENMPYDDFITWQLAGDLLPNATRDQKLATAFHRNHPVSAEGGIIDEEFRVKYVQDRTNTTATAFLGLTLECATCHDHKFDPISQKEYYQMSAFFNNLRELGMVGEENSSGGSSGPVLLLPEPEREEKLARLSEEIDQTYEQLELTKSEVAATEDFIASIQSMAIDPPVADGFYPMETVRPEKSTLPGEGGLLRILRNSPIDEIVDENLKSLACGEPQVVKGRFGNALRLEQEFDLVFLKDVGNFEMNQPFSAGGWIHTEKEGENQSIMGTSGDGSNYWRGWDLFIDTLNRPSVLMISFWPHNYMQITADISVPKAEWHHILYTYDGSGQASGIHLYVDGRKIKCSIDYNNLYRPIVHKWKKQKGWRERPVMVGRSGRNFTGDNGVFYGSIDHLKIFNRYLTSLEVTALFVEETKVSPSQTDSHRGDGYQDKEANYIDHYLNRKHSGYRSLIKELQKLLGKKLELIQDVPEIMVMEDMPEPRKTFVLKRGQYNDPTEEVGPGTPGKVLPFASDLPKNRLGLAQWLVDKNNPLTARVTVNRYWQMIFGRGMVETPHDFGTQGALPTHPELLDWLAIQFMESGLGPQRFTQDYGNFSHLPAVICSESGTLVQRCEESLPGPRPELPLTGRNDPG